MQTLEIGTTLLLDPPDKPCPRKGHQPNLSTLPFEPWDQQSNIPGYGDPHTLFACGDSHGFLGWD
jgi:hypothetical protein